MNNEEKILALLEQMNADISEFKQGQASLKQEMDARFDKVDARFDEVDKTLNSIESSVDYAAKDARMYITRHEKEFHNVG